MIVRVEACAHAGGTKCSYSRPQATRTLLHIHRHVCSRSCLTWATYYPPHYSLVGVPAYLPKEEPASSSSSRTADGGRHYNDITKKKSAAAADLACFLACFVAR